MIGSPRLIVLRSSHGNEPWELGKVLYRKEVKGMVLIIRSCAPLNRVDLEAWSIPVAAVNYAIANDIHHIYVYTPTPEGTLHRSSVADLCANGSVRSPHQDDHKLWGKGVCLAKKHWKKKRETMVSTPVSTTDEIPITEHNSLSLAPLKATSRVKATQTALL